MQRMINNPFVQTVCYGISLLAAAVFSLPVLWLAVVSFMKRKDLFLSPPRIAFEPTLSNYKTAFIEQDAALEVLLSLTICLLAAGIAVILAASFLLVSRIVKGGFPNFDGVLFPAYAIPGSVIAIPFFFYSKALGLAPVLSFLLGVSSIALMVSLLMLSGFFRGMPPSCIDSLSIARREQLVSNTLLLASSARSSLFIAFLFAFLVCWHDLAIGVVTSGVGFRTLNVSIIGLITPVGTYWGEIAARSMPSLLLAFTFSFFANERILRGFSFGR